MITYKQFLVLASLNVWPEDGQPLDGFVNFIVSSTEGDPRGDISYDQAKEAFDEAMIEGWVNVLPGKDEPSRPFVYPSIIGKEVFEENKDYWAELSR